MSEIEIMHPGPFSHIQDSGRRRYEHLGLSRSGPADFRLFAIAHTLVGNSLEDAAIEMTYQGLEFIADTPIIFSVAGVQDIRIGSHLYHNKATFSAKLGEVVRLTKLRGQRAYLAIRGGLDTPLVLGSRATDFTAAIGGWQGRSLRKGDRIPIKNSLDASISQDTPSSQNVEWPQDFWDDYSPFRVVVGPDDKEFSTQALHTFFAGDYAMTPASNIMGIRLKGVPVKGHGESATKLSKGTVPGSIQVPPDGQPIILLNQRGTIGGYPVLATLPSPELWRLAQWPASKKLSFMAITPAQARTLGYNAFQSLMAWRRHVMAD